MYSVPSNPKPAATTPGRRRIGPQRNSGRGDRRAMNPHKALDWMLLVLRTAAFVVLLVPVMVLTHRPALARAFIFRVWLARDYFASSR